MTLFWLLLTGLVSGTFGALVGLGGGVILIPILTIFFQMPIHTAIGISLVGVIATSTGAAITFVKEGKADVKLGMTLELGTTIGAIIGAIIAGLVSSRTLYFLFTALLVYNTYSMYQKSRRKEAATVADSEELFNYQVKNIPLGVASASIAGILSGLLGIGGGLVKIPVMYLLMNVPLKVAAATSNFMIGVTATASAFIYYLNGKINPVWAVPVALGVFVGAKIGTRISTRISTRMLQRVFIIIFIYTAVEMVLKGIGG